MRDSQRSAVYRWERRVLLGTRLGQELTKVQCEDFAHSVLLDYSVPPHIRNVFRVRFTRRYQVAQAARWWVKLPPWSRNYPTLLHELAHIVVYTKYVKPVPGHGREFATTLLVMWERYLGVRRAWAREIGIKQRPRRVHFAKLAHTPHPFRASPVQYKHPIIAARRKP